VSIAPTSFVDAFDGNGIARPDARNSVITMEGGKQYLTGVPVKEILDWYKAAS
jgi:hypothetical protein